MTQVGRISAGLLDKNSFFSAQHTEAAERMRFRRTVKIVDKMLEEDDSNKDGLISFPEFMSAYHARRLDGLKLRKVKNEA